MKKPVKWMLAIAVILLLLFIPYTFFQDKLLALSGLSKEKTMQMVQKEIVRAKNIDETPEEDVKRVDAEERLHFLLLGTDERPNEPSRSDTIVLATYYPNEGKMNMLSIPRDTQVTINGKTEKINAGHALGGMPLVKETVETWSGVHIDYVAKVNFNGFTELIEEAGGVTVNPQKEFSYGGDTFKVGKQKLDGKEALNYVRFRKNEDGDFGRIKRQQEVIQNTVSAVLDDFNLLSIPTYLNFYRKHVESDMSFGDMYHVAKVAYSNGVHFESKTVLTHSTKENGIWYELADDESKASVLAWLENRPKEVLPSPHEEKEELEMQKNRVSGQLSTP